MSSLDVIESRIERRIHTIRSTYPDWLCRRGCDSCCRRLAELPLMTRAEWLRLREGLSRLSPDVLAIILRDIATLSDSPGPLACPMLDADGGICRVYPFRPLACRSYGYYRQRGVGLHCKQIEEQVDAGLLDDVVWGNQDALERDLRSEGDWLSLKAWIDDPLDGMN